MRKSKTMKKFELNIKRYIYNDSKTTGGEANNIGDFFIEGAFFCYSLEDEIRFSKVYGKTAIPDGRYRVVLNWSNRFKRIMPLLLDVPNFTGVRLHGGNTAEDSHGCPLIAFNLIENKTKIQGTADRPRLSVYRSLTNIYAQLVDDASGTVLASASSLKIKKGKKTDLAKQVGEEIAKLAKTKKITTCIFDRGGYLYHGFCSSH